MMREPGPHPDSQASSRRTCLGGTVSVGMKLRLAAEKLPLKPHETPNRPDRVAKFVNKFR